MALKHALKAEIPTINTEEKKYGFVVKNSDLLRIIDAICLPTLEHKLTYRG